MKPFILFGRSGALESSPASSEKQKENHYQEHEADTTPAVIAESWTHIVAAAAEEQE